MIFILKIKSYNKYIFKNIIIKLLLYKIKLKKRLFFVIKFEKIN